MAQNLEENSVSIVLLGDDEGIKEGSTIKRTGKVVSVPVEFPTTLFLVAEGAALGRQIAFSVHSP